MSASESGSSVGIKRPVESNLLSAWKLSVCTAGGMMFGFAAEKGRVHLPSVIQNQMSMTQFTMMKMFLAATTAGSVCFFVLAVIPSTKKLFHQVRENYTIGLGARRIAAFIVGGSILGMGMTVSGACPGMVLVQVGAGVQYSLITLAGCYFGAVLYGVLNSALSDVIFLSNVSRKYPGTWLDKKFGLPYMIPSIVLTAILISVLAVLEHRFPWRTEVPVSPESVGLLRQESWAPILAGFVMGSLQLCVAFSVGDSLGGSSAYCTVLSQTGLGKRISYFTSYGKGIGNWWQVFYWIGAVAGAGLSAYFSDTWGQGVGVKPLMAFLGGAMMLFGARLASGCTSGHGLSGISLLSTASFLTVPAMFAGGMALAFGNKMFS